MDNMVPNIKWLDEYFNLSVDEDWDEFGMWPLGGSSDGKREIPSWDLK